MCLLSPTTPTVAFPIGERADDPVAMYKADLATLPSSLYGGPAMSLPAGLGDDDLPVGVQLMARRPARRAGLPRRRRSRSRAAANGGAAHCSTGFPSSCPEVRHDQPARRC